MENVLETKNLSKCFGKFTAVDGVSLSVNRGEIYGFLGLNGAGKTTTIRMLLGMIRQSGGDSFILGKKVDAGQTALWNKIGYLVEIPYAYPELTVEENIDMFRRLRGISDKSAVDRTIDLFKLGTYRDKPARHLSLGNAQRLGLAKAMIHEPEILILDEPSNGLDPAGIVEIRELLLGLAAEKGVTVFISSHNLDEISRIASRIGIIHEGRLVQEVNASELDKLRRKRLAVNARDRDGAAAALKKAGYNFTPSEEGYLETSDDAAVKFPDKVSAMLAEAKFPPTLLSVVEEDLETYFLRIVENHGGNQ